MYVYLITNLINNKKYVGITNNYKKRWANHKCSNSMSMPIAQAIKKYGPDDFKFELIESNVPIDEIDEKEKYYIKLYNTLTKNGYGYNVAEGGQYSIAHSVHTGCKNGRALLSNDEVAYIKSHRNMPEYELYDEFCDKISYIAFKNIYNDKTYKDIPPTVDKYPYNTEYSLQFSSGKLSLSQVQELREQYKNLVY